MMVLVGGLTIECWERVGEGHGQAVLLAGEAGIGKSRLVEAFKHELTTDSYTHWEGRCSQYHQDSALHPIIDVVGRVFEFEIGDSAAVKLTKIRAGLEALGLASTDSLWAWASLLSVPLPTMDSSLELSPSQQKRKGSEAIASLLKATASRRPVLFMLEDIHWADASTLDLLDFHEGPGGFSRLGRWLSPARWRRRRGAAAAGEANT